MAKLFVVIALCLLPAMAVAARQVSEKQALFTVVGKAYCDTCQAEFETPASKYIQGAKVKIQCVNRKTNAIWTSPVAETDSTGTYQIAVYEDHEGEDCAAMLVSSSTAGCTKPDPNRSHATVILCGNNGIVNEKRTANNMGFLIDEPLAVCAKVMQQYQLTDEDV